MAEVWYAQNELGKEAAVKILKKELTLDPNIVQRFKNEAKVMLTLNHPNIRQVYDMGNIQNRPCIIMEYLEGNDLKQLLNQGRKFEHNEMVSWWNQLTDALIYTHNKKIIHRDIKPSNIFLTNDGKIKILDFGIAKIQDSISTTQTGTNIGTVLYMSPEQVKNSKNVTYKTDIYSLAVTFYHILLGKAPYDETNSSTYDIQNQIVNHELNLAILPDAWKKHLIKYLNKDPNSRENLKKWDNHNGQNPDIEKLFKQKKAWMIMFIVSIVLLIGISLVSYLKNKEIQNDLYETRSDNESKKELILKLSDVNQKAINKIETIEDIVFQVGENKNITDGGYDNEYYMHFETAQPLIIQSVVVKSKQTGTITIEIYDYYTDIKIDESEAYYLDDYYTYIEVPINIKLPEPGEYYMAFTGDIDLYYLSSGHNYNNYNNGIIKITGSSNSPDIQNDKDYYQYFFAWKVKLLLLDNE